MNQHSVYIAYDVYGEILYVGRTSKGERRLRQHGKEREWWPRVHHVMVDHYASKEEAALREYEAIRYFVPEYNIDVPTVLVWPEAWTAEMRSAFARRWPLLLLRDKACVRPPSEPAPEGIVGS